MKYRAQLFDPGDTQRERPLITYGNDRSLIDEWAATVLAKAVSDNASVQIFVTTEHLVRIVDKPLKKEATSANPS